MNTKTKLVNIRLKKDIHKRVEKACEEFKAEESFYVKYLLIKGLSDYKDAEIIKEIAKKLSKNKENAIYERGYYSVRISPENFVRLKLIAAHTGCTMPKLCGYYIEKMLNEEKAG